MAGKSTESVAKALRLLTLFRGVQEPVRIAEASDATGLARSTTHRLLATLVASDFVRQDPRSRAYFAGDALIGIARALFRDTELRDLALSEMQSLVKRTGETTNLCVLREGKVLFLDGVESQHVLRITARIGAVGIPYATAAGKALLAELPEDTVQRMYPRERLPRVTAGTISSKRKLLRTLADIRTTGYATSAGESNAGVYAVACAIKSPGGVHGALTIAAPVSRTTAESSAMLATELRRAAARIAAHFP